MAAPTSDETTRGRVIDAAIDCILEQGFYRASSNEIARAAGVTWGVIQYHFGTREALMLAALEDSGRRLAETVEHADVSGRTVEQRLAKFLDLLRSYYGEPRYLAYLQILLNLSRDPQTSEETARAIRGTNRRLQSRLIALESEVLGEVPDDSPLKGLIFHASRGLALSHLVLGATTSSQTRINSEKYDEQARLLVRALSSLAAKA